MKAKGLLIGIGLAATLALPSQAEDAVEIGMITTLSGPAGYLGQDIRDAFQLAIDMEGGTLGGVPVELKVEDDGLNPGKGREIAEGFIQNDGIKLLTGIVFSNVAMAVVPEVLDGGDFYVSPNAGPSPLAGKGCDQNYFVVSWQNDALHEPAGVAASDAGYKTAYVLAPNYQAGKDAIAGFKRTFTGEIVGETYTPLGQTDFASAMAEIRAAAPDVVYEFYPGGMGIAFLKQYSQAGLTGQIPLVLSEPSLDAVILKAVGDAAVGVQLTSHWNEDFDNASNKAFVAAWKEAYPDRPMTTYASQGYDTALLIASALNAAGSPENEDAFREALRKAEFESVRGAFKFGANQHPIQDWYLLKIEAGADGSATTTTQKKLLSDYGDPYMSQCKM
ncbi:ABC transporter substrate-binding protein [Frigidibacter sp. ROC022]|uniref:ABC transporter substrate-binding protein n=1 Tax=Frigidibacter sp. ROC022 TaxID=2971796 RepID=UPI00215A4420|nr:ABC transporter substrate-binding protein [Frigidibacter sp. ROC022]MCR8726719.1 ABC transporter substrate-binding protein [Frigidibacter sp. ROC022]